MFWKKFQVSGSDKTPVPEVTKPRFLFTRCTLLSLVELIHSSINAKERQKSDKLMPSKKSVKVSFVTK